MMKRLLPLLVLAIAGCQSTRQGPRPAAPAMPPPGAAPAVTRPLASPAAPATAIAAEQQSLEQKQRTLQRSLGDLAATLEAQNRRNTTLTSQLESARNDLFETAKEIRTIKERIDGLASAQTTNLAAIAALRQQIQAKQTELEQIRSALSAAPSRMAELEREAEKAKAARLVQEEELRARDRQIAELRRSLDDQKRLLKEQKSTVKTAAPEPAVDAAAQAVAAADAAKVVAQANNLLAAGHAVEAQALYENVLKARPSMIPALAGLAGAQYARADYVTAGKTADRVLDLDARNAQALAVKGLVYRKDGSTTRASALLGQAVESDPQDPRLRNYYGIALNDRGRRDEAIVQFRKAAELDPGYAEAHFNLACLLATAQPPRLDEAREHYRRAVALGSEHDADLDRILGAP